jgi:hypothetical protein
LELFIVSKKFKGFKKIDSKAECNRYVLGPLNPQFLFRIIPHLSFLELFGIRIIGNGWKGVGEGEGAKAVF